MHNVEIEKLEKSIQALGSARADIHESFSYFSDQERISVLGIASELISSIETKMEEERDFLLVEDEKEFKLQQKCHKTVKCFICGKRVYGGCPA